MCISAIEKHRIYHKHTHTHPLSHYPTRFARFAAICSPLILILSGATPSPPSPWRTTLTPPRALKWSRQRRCHGGRGRGWDEMDLVWPGEEKSTEIQGFV